MKKTKHEPIARFVEAYTRASVAESFDASRCALATVGADGRPSVRFVLVKSVDERGFCFHTHYDSRKGRELAENPCAALVYHWAAIGEQVRVEGRVELLSSEESDRYFAERPRGSQIGAWASPQSAPIADRAGLESRVAEFQLRFEGGRVPRPPRWGGYRLVPDRVEFWIDREDRLHDRFLYTRQVEGWTFGRLAP